MKRALIFLLLMVVTSYLFSLEINAKVGAVSNLPFQGKTVFGGSVEFSLFKNLRVEPVLLMGVWGETQHIDDQKIDNWSAGHTIFDLNLNYQFPAIKFKQIRSKIFLSTGIGYLDSYLQSVVSDYSGEKWYSVNQEGKSSFTKNIGTGLKIYLQKGLYIRGEYRYYWTKYGIMKMLAIGIGDGW